MYGVLIAEDEMLVRFGLKNSIDWSRFGMSIVADAPDGQSAYDMYEKTNPDIVITDIKMPVMDGMQLISKIRETDRRTKIIILTCLEEFGLAKKAVSLGVSEYIPKLDMSKKDIESILLRMQAELNESARDSQTQNDAHGPNETVFREMTLDQLFAQNSFDQFARQYDLNLCADNLALCLVSPTRAAALPAGNENRSAALESSVFNVLRELLNKNASGKVFRDRDGRFAFLYNPGETTDFRRHALDMTANVSDLLRMYFSMEASFGISGPCSGYSMVEKMYRQASEALESRFFLGSGTYFCKSHEIDRLVAQRIEAVGTLPALQKALSVSEYSKIRRMAKELFVNAQLTEDAIKKAFCELVQFIACEFYALYCVELLENVFSSIQKIEACSFLDECVGILKDFIESLASICLEENGKSDIAKAIQYIQINYMNDLTLAEVARFVNMSRGYFCNVFKKEMQQNFVGYLNAVRVDKAKKLLLGTGFRACEIAERTGFADNTYFCKVFKKATGFSPNQFRRMMPSGQEQAQ